MLRLLSFIVAYVFLAECIFAEGRHPNIVLFLADDMGLGDIQAYDPTSTIPTPNMDRLARAGIRFIDAHAPASSCTPSRYGILTGRYPFRATPIESGVVKSSYEKPLINAETIAGRLKRGGYATAAFGKWHLGMNFKRRDGDGYARTNPKKSLFTTDDVDFSQPIENGPLDHGFDYFFGHGSAHNHGPYTFIENRSVTVVPTEMRKQIKHPGTLFSREGWVAPGWQDDQVGPITCNKVLEWIERHSAGKADTPFFIYYAATANHWPHLPPESLNGQPVKGQGGNDDGVSLRNDTVYENDVIIGQLLERLNDPNSDGDKEDSILSDTLIIVMSDNGADEGFFSAISGKKGSMLEGGHRVPWIVSWPGVVPEDKVSHAFITGNDLYATLGALVGTEALPGMGQDSVNVLDSLLGRSWSNDRADKGWLHHKSCQTQHLSWRQGQWKLILKDGVPIQLFDLENDLLEKVNLVRKRPTLVKRLHLEFQKVFESSDTALGI